MPISDQTNAPAGLKYNRGYATRLWVRPDSMSFRKLFAVHFTSMHDGVHRTALDVAGYLGGFVFDWHNPEHARSLLVAQRITKHSRRLLGSLVDEGGGEWLLCNQPNSSAAASCPDANYVAHRCLCDHAIKGSPGVYFISNGRNAVKIGKSRHCINSRFLTLQTASPDALRVLAVIADPSPCDIELHLHELLESKRIRGEWFAISDAEAISLAVQNGGRELNEFPG